MINSNTQQLAPSQNGAANAPCRQWGQRRDLDCDPLGKRESAANSQRDTKRREIRSKKKIANLTKAAAREVEVMLLNIRGINTTRKQIMLAQEMNKRSPHIMILTETKLTRQIGLNGYTTNQTQKNRGGGCWVGAAAQAAKQIKSFSNAISWTKIELGNSHQVHVLAVYMTPGKKERQEHDVAHIDHILGQLSNSTFGPQQIILAGDFNEALEEVTKVATKYNLKQTVQSGTATHWKGGHLDQIYTNMEHGDVEVTSVDKRLSDHAKICVKVRSNNTHREGEIPKETANPSQAWIRRQANKEENIRKIMDREHVTSTPMKEVIQQENEKKTLRWYQPKAKKGSHLNSEGFYCEGTAMSKVEWATIIKRLESLHKQGEWKEFYKLVANITKLKRGSCLVQAVKKGEWQSSNDEERDEAIATFMKELYQGQVSEYQDKCEVKSNIFTPDDVQNAISESNFSKAIGPDMLDGGILLKNEALRGRVAMEISQMLNEARFPDYFLEGRLTSLSKKGNESIVELEDIRPIVVRSHLTKITEKAVLAKLQDKHSHLIKTAMSQSGFKKGKSTADNITKMLMTMHPGKGRKKKTAVLLIDLRKAYDSVDRDKLFQVLMRRCRDEKDRQMVDIIARLHGKARIWVGKNLVETLKGLAQGSVLAPILFNIYLEEALKEAQTCASKYRTGDLLCYADDIMCLISSVEEGKRVITELTEHLGRWGLHLNLNKSEILGMTDQQQIEEIKCREQVKYLGMNITLGSANQRKAAAQQVERNLKGLKSKVRGCSPALKETLIGAYIRSLLLYFGLPMCAAGLWDRKQIDSIEASLYRSMHGVPRDIANATVMNVTQGTLPTSSVICRKAAALKRETNRQSPISWAKEEIQRGQPATRTRLYLPREVASTMMALTRGRTVIFFGKRHVCVTHNHIIDDEHLRKCGHFEGLPSVHEWTQRLRTTNIREWDQADLAAAVVGFTLLKARINELEANGKITLKDILDRGIALTPTPVIQMEDTEMKEAVEGKLPEEGPDQAQALPVKRGRGRPRKVENLMDGQLPITFFIKKKERKAENVWTEKQ